MSAGRSPLSDPTTEAARLLCRLALIILMILTPTAELVLHSAIYVLLPVGAGVLVIAGWLTGGARGRRDLAAVLITPIGLAGLFLISWTGLSLIWTAFPAEAGARFGRTFGTGLVVLLAIAFLPERTKASNLYLLPIGVALTAAATAFLIAFGPPSFWSGGSPDYALAQRCLMSVCVLLWPALGALALRERWIMAAGLAFVVAVAAFTAFEQVALISVAMGAVTYAIAMTRASATAQVAAFGAAALLLLAPILALFALPVAALAHLPDSGPTLVAADVITAYWPRLITGHGLDMVARAIELGALPVDTPRSILFTIWYELGLLGALSFAVLGALVFLAAGRAPAHVAPPLLAGLVAGFVIALSGAETTQLWWMTLAGLDAIAFALLFKGHPRAKRPLAPVTDEIDEETDQAVES
jgi:hypothetical protein